jgi:Domain of unknown function (DUF397)
MGDGEVHWRRACGTESSCVEVAFIGDEVLVRSSSLLDGPTLSFTRDEWATFVVAVKNDEFSA